MQSKFSLANQRILITGAGGGIGSTTAAVCAQQGAEVILVDRTHKDALVSQLEAAGHIVSFHACDVSKREEVEALCKRIGPVDAAILNAGVNTWGPWTEDDFDSVFEQTMDVNVLGSINFCRALLPGMKAQGRGRLVLMGSVVAWTGGTMESVPLHYVISKGGVHAMLKWLVRRASPEVLVNAVAPGPVRTAMNADQPWTPPSSMPIPRLADPQEIAWPMAFLCSDAASFINGVVLDINGGNYMR
ncbi:SDR family oxidoreductase [Polaromonas sp.]|uniref:SDR family NAD(P)-dependent oxidoreductase n=1 Tax=Polaromonas sp. TaxID=1869339 RepID=UPI001DBE6B14|nr:SDR family oxidoreductase [Polaromonas sp.]MBT9476168.1 SDR family oxidoreductase [Polaromonas sp.]